MIGFGTTTLNASSVIFDQARMSRSLLAINLGITASAIDS